MRWKPECTTIAVDAHRESVRLLLKEKILGA